MKISYPFLPYLTFIHKKSRVFSLLLLASLSISCRPDTAQHFATEKIDLHQEKVVLWLPPQPLPVEKQIPLRLQLPAGVTPELSELGGESMYMGVSPVQWQQGDEGEWHAQLYLGACTEHQMTWRLTIPLATQGDLPASVSATFSSEAN
ncbi:hypothetical protein [Pseudidiomarina insulisalsae]|uniref:YtkA-like domain-containing protein n=1 Tax=Pseudidiomarina insulisalsae TaxID=575789 RepID=A0A432YHD1_9GAMM|nr:hypothetical protein [Pseudidiomarina insulisalsae]RUO60315.1 hypothetical protein CWI71_07885 [Pseudidiomarina insulisalsae]